MTSQASKQIMEVVAQNILHARLAADMTQREVGVALEMDARGVSRWETGRVAPSRTKLSQLADLFGVDPGWFYTDHSRRRAAA
ncbi:MAG: helix-turn-helix transcriptional regulator [Patescibacteria group bacterium]|nr:helix-turn-helix transcriptional regulator [Patescibacteria group bacterium]